MSEKPNLDLIGLVQQARLAHDAAAQPSQVTARYWLEARGGGTQPTPTVRAGCWALRVPLSAIDARWAAVRQATEAGLLGYKAKTSGRGSEDERIIQVMTYDADDAADVARIRAALRAPDLDGDWVYERA